ncbi:hypothetical protein M426DRAFT_269071 [Hypoxylon sp. CI-4A]|nr:hypothetical protein M426DRAFT_269071 [Hypoxylon sp. CI-4A]
MPPLQKTPGEYSTNINTVRARNRKARLSLESLAAEQARASDNKAINRAKREVQKKEDWVSASQEEKERMENDAMEQAMSRRRKLGRDAPSKMARFHPKNQDSTLSPASTEQSSVLGANQSVLDMETDNIMGFGTFNAGTVQDGAIIGNEQGIGLGIHYGAALNNQQASYGSSLNYGYTAPAANGPSAMATPSLAMGAYHGHQALQFQQTYGANGIEDLSHYGLNPATTSETQVNNRLDVVNHRLETCEVNYTALETRVEAHQESIAAHQQNLEAHQQNLEAHQQNMEAHQQNMEASQQSLQELQDFRNQHEIFVQIQLQPPLARIDTLERNFQQQAARVEALEQDMQNFQTQLPVLVEGHVQAQIQTLLQGRMAAVENLEARVKTLEEEIERMRDPATYYF